MLGITHQLFFIFFFTLIFIVLSFLFFRLSLLVVFYAQVLGKSTSGVPLRICIFGNTFFLVICIILSISSEASRTKSTIRHTLSDVYVAVASFISFLIAGLLGYFGQKFSEFCKTEKVNRALLPHTENKFHLMNWILVAIFTLRGILIILSAMNTGHFPSDTEVVKVNSDTETTNMEFSYFLITEILPSSFVLLNLWQALCPKDFSKSTIAVDDNLCNHSEMNEKYNDMFSPRGSHLSRDGDDDVRVVSSFVLDLQNQSKANDVEDPNKSASLPMETSTDTTTTIPLSPTNAQTESPIMTLKIKPTTMITPNKTTGAGLIISPSLSPTSPLHKKPMYQNQNKIVNPSITIQTDETIADLSQSNYGNYSPTIPISQRHILAAPQMSPTTQLSSDDNISEGRPSDSNELQYFHQDLKIERVTPKSLIYSTTSNGSTDRSTNSSINSRIDRHSKNVLFAPRPHPSLTSSASSANSIASAAPSLKNWLGSSDPFESTPPPLTRPPSAPATTTSICTDTFPYNNNNNNTINNSNNPRNSLGNGRASPFPSILTRSNEENSLLLKKVANALSPKYILQG